MFFFFFNDTATTEIYTLSLHDALPILSRGRSPPAARSSCIAATCSHGSRVCSLTRPARGSAHSWSQAFSSAWVTDIRGSRSEEHTSELQSRLHLVCRLLLEKKKVCVITSAYYTANGQSESACRDAK